MKPKRIRLILLMMAGSFSLLIVLQVMWISSAYEKAFVDFRRDVNLIFKNTMVNLRNEQWAKNMVEISGDSALVEMTVVHGDSMRGRFQKKREQGGRINERKETESIYIGNSDGKKQLAIRTTIEKLKRDSIAIPEGRSFVIRLNPDTISLDTLELSYRNALLQAGVSVPFKLKHLRPEPGFDMPLNPMADFVFENQKEFTFASPEEKRAMKFNPRSDTVHTDAVRMSPVHFYGASFYQVRGFLIRQITPQLLFSFFLTTMISAVFMLLFKTVRAQQRLSDEKTNLINNITHELKTPVSTVSVALEAIRDFAASSNPTLREEYIDIARRELHRLTAITDKILKAAGVESEDDQVTFAAVDLLLITKECIDSMKLLATAHDTTLALKTSGEQYLISGSTDHLRNVVLNLIDNAIKYSSKNNVVTVILKASNGQVVLKVTDRGVGIESAYHGKIFEKFFRVPTGDVHTIKGYGLGLSYVETTVRKHGGTISVNSAPGEGSEFTLRFPAVV